MKKLISLLFIISFSIVAWSQTNTFPTAGNVGIGTLSPTNKLDVRGHIYMAGDGHSAKLKTNLSSSTYSQELKFWNNKMAYVWGGGIKTYFSSASDIWFGDFAHGTGVNAFQLDARIGATKSYNTQNLNELYIQTGGAPRMWVFGDGNIAIGARENSGDRLNVRGAIRATEIKVEAQTADFVFEDDYILRPLDEVEAFVKTNKHLPEIPSAKQMEADGVNVAEMNKLLLQKVEELTLYLLEQNQRMETQSQQIEQLNQKVNQLQKSNITQ